MGQNTTVFWGNNPSQMYMDALVKLVNDGKEYAPRGKAIRELRPVVFEYHNPLNRVTFLKGRIINPFFQLAEAFWIMTGRSDVEWLKDYNASISQFSDDGVYFNAPYGERLRHWGKNDARKFVLNPIDQLYDCYKKLKEDLDTRQAVGFIGNPHFDSSEYTLSGGKDIACNLNIKFKVRGGKLDISVDNRSNDLHWGVFGANLCQFATLQELMASWLGVEVGTYYQVTDSLHIYLDSYGAQETWKVLSTYGISEGDELPNTPRVQQFNFATEPRMSSSYLEFEHSCDFYYRLVEPKLLSEETYGEDNHYEWEMVLEALMTCPDEYLRLTFIAMLAKQAHNRKQADLVIDAMVNMEDCSWKVSCLRFLYKSYGHSPEFQSLYKHLPESAINYIERKDITDGR